jgi:UPF0716 protein FxsA
VLLRLIALLIFVPLVELALLLWMAQYVGWLWTLALVIVTGTVGAWLVRWQGFRILWRVREDLTAGRLPTDGLIDGVLVLAAGLLLLTPGVLTDLAGFSLLIPPCRRFVRWRLRRMVQSRFRIASFYQDAAGRFYSQTGPFAPGGDASPQDDRVIDSHGVREESPEE